MAGSTPAGQSGEDITHVKHGVPSPELQGEDSGGATQSGATGQGSKYTQSDRRRTRRAKTAKMEMTERRGRVTFKGYSDQTKCFLLRTASDSGIKKQVFPLMKHNACRRYPSRLIEIKCFVFLFFKNIT